MLETDAAGVPNWKIKPDAVAEQPAGAPSEGLHLAVGKLDIVDWTLVRPTYPADRQDSCDLAPSRCRAPASVGLLPKAHPFSIGCTATVNGVPLSLAVSRSMRLSTTALAKPLSW